MTIGSILERLQIFLASQHLRPEFSLCYGAVDSPRCPYGRDVPLIFQVDPPFMPPLERDYIELQLTSLQLCRSFMQLRAPREGGE
jgi:hypothetical protein